MREQLTEITQRENNPFFIKGQKITIDNSEGILTEHEILNVFDTQKAIKTLGLNYNIKDPAQVLIIDKKMHGNLAAYHPELNIILGYNDTPPHVMHHEIIHSLEMKKPLTDALIRFYEKVLETLPDNSNLHPNYRKDIHEFIADAYSKEGLIETLRGKELYGEFEKLTKYIFE